MKTTLTLAFIVAKLVVAAPREAAAQNREHQQIAADIRMLHEQTQQLAITLAALTEALTEALASMNARLDQAADATLKGFADQRLIIDGLGDDLRVVRERVDETNVRVSTLGQEVDALRATIPALLQGIPAGGAGAVPPGANPGDPADTTPVVPSVAGISPTRMYETAFADYSAGQWSLAITGFEAFLRTFPRSEQADDAQFYVGETYFNQNLMPEAISAYNRVIDNYAGADAVRLAYYKRGLAHERLGQVEAARASWEQVVADYPASDAGRLAQQNLDRLSRQAP
jgi:tol-pal system protein YbgF